MREQQEKCLNRAISLLSRVSYSRSKLEGKLKDKFDQETITNTIKQLEEMGLYSEEKELGIWLRYYENGKKSRREIEYALYRKGFPKELIQIQLEEMDEDRDREILARLIDQLKSKNNLSDEKIFSRLLRKGFSAEAIKKNLRKYSDDIEPLI